MEELYTQQQSKNHTSSRSNFQQYCTDDLNSQTRSQRIREEIFPETDVYVEREKQQTNTNEQLTGVQRLAKPTQMLKNAIIHLINYQEDVECSLKSIQEFTQLLSDSDRNTIAKACALLNQLSLKDSARTAFVTSQQLIQAILKLISTTSDSEILQHSLSTLNNLCRDKSALQFVFKFGGIAYLVRLLGSQIDNVLYYAITILHLLLVHEDASKLQVRKCGGIQKMCSLLTHTNQKFLAVLLDSLKILAFSSNESKLIIAASKCPKELVRLMRTSNYEKLIWTCVRLIKVLSICSTNKPALIECGAMQILTDHLQTPSSERILLNCLIALRNLSDCAIREENLEDLVKRLIEFLLTSNDLNVSICAAGILSNLTCNNDFNKMKFVEYNGIEALVRLMIQTKENREEIFEPIVCSLRHVTNRHANAHKAQETIRFNYGLPIIVQILQSDTNRWPLVKACIGLVRNLALSENNLTPLRELGVIPRLVQLLVKSLNYHQVAEKQGQQEAIVDDVPMEEIIEGSVGALHQLARDQHNRVIIRELKCIPLLVQLLSMNWESIQRVACGCLCELANDKESTELIDQEQATERLTELLRSKDEAIATYAAAVLFRLSEDKSNVPNANFKGEHNQNIEYSAYNTIDPYELNDLQQHQQSRISPALVNFNPTTPSTQQQQQQPAAWFDTDL